jgi:hypothetical protein
MSVDFPDVSLDDIEVRYDEPDGQTVLLWRGHVIAPSRLQGTLTNRRHPPLDRRTLRAYQHLGVSLLRRKISAMSHHERIEFYARTRGS